MPSPLSHVALSTSGGTLQPTSELRFQPWNDQLRILEYHVGGSMCSTILSSETTTTTVLGGRLLRIFSTTWDPPFLDTPQFHVPAAAGPGPRLVSSPSTNTLRKVRPGTSTWASGLVSRGGKDNAGWCGLTVVYDGWYWLIIVYKGLWWFTMLYDD